MGLKAAGYHLQTKGKMKELEELMLTLGFGPFIGVRTNEWSRGYMEWKSEVD